MRRLVLACCLVACAAETPSWTVPLPPKAAPEPWPWRPERIEVLERYGAPVSMELLDDGRLLWSDGGAVHLGSRVLDTPGWAWRARWSDGAVLVADGQNGVIRWDPAEGDTWTRVSDGEAVWVDRHRALLAQGWVTDTRTGNRVAVDGSWLRSLTEDGERWAVTAMDGGLIVGEGDRVVRTVRLRSRLALPHDGSWLVWTHADTLVDLEGEQLAEGVGAVAATDPPTWATGGTVHRLGQDAPVRARADARVILLEAAADGPLVAWSDGLLEQLRPTGPSELGRFVPNSEEVPEDLLVEPSSRARPSPDGLVLDDHPAPFPLPDGRPADRVAEGHGWRVGLQRSSGTMVAVQDDGRVVRRMLPGMANQAVVLPGLLVVSLGGRGVAGVPLDRPTDPVQVIHLGDARWAGLCGNGQQVLQVWGDSGLLLLEAEQGRLVERGRLDTPGRAKSCAWRDGGWEVHDGASRLRVDPAMDASGG